MLNSSMKFQLNLTIFQQITHTLKNLKNTFAIILQET